MSSIYERCAGDLLLELGNLYDDEFAIVFAHHPEFNRHSLLIDAMLNHGMGKQIRSCTVARPADVCALQVADIVAYEICREEREIGIRRYPLQRLSALGCTFRISSAIE
jgi:hypothetical protein